MNTCYSLFYVTRHINTLWKNDCDITAYTFKINVYIFFKYSKTKVKSCIRSYWLYLTANKFLVFYFNNLLLTYCIIFADLKICTILFFLCITALSCLILLVCNFTSNYYRTNTYCRLNNAWFLLSHNYSSLLYSVWLMITYYNMTQVSKYITLRH